jgi:alpha-glucosidase
MTSAAAWWKEAVFYHIYLRSFADSDGDGLGDLQGLLDRLDHLRGTHNSLGVDAIWLSPCYPSPDKDFGYDVADYTAIDPRYGDLATFNTLLAACHHRDLRLLMDLVFNHTSDQHPWFQESRSSRTNARRDWYIWRDPRPGGRAPNNWQSVFGGPAWAWDAATQQYYLHSFLKEQPDLNWRNPQVRKALEEVVRFWLRRGVDGFRLDVFNLWYKHADLPDNPFKLGIRPYEMQRHIYDMDQGEMMPALACLRGILEEFGERVAVGEFMGDDVQLAASYAAPDRLHMVFNFRFTRCRWDPAAFQREVMAWQEALGNQGWPCYVLSNHDLPRAVTRYGGRHPDQVAKVAGAMLLTLRGTPFIYYGEEIAMPDLRLRRDQILDPPGKRYWPFYRGRDGARGAMLWDDSPQAGFTRGEPWLPVHPEYRQRNLERQKRDPRSVFNFYRALISLRRELAPLRLGSFVPLQSRPRGGWAYLRHLGDRRLLVGLNFKAHPIQVSFDEALAFSRAELLLSSAAQGHARLGACSIELQPMEAALFLLH